MKRFIAGGVGIALLALGGVSSADAGSTPATTAPPTDGPVPGTKVSGSNSGQSVFTFWTQVDTRPDGTPVPPGVAPFGNVHVGTMEAYQFANTTTIKIPGQKKTKENNEGMFAFAQILDFDCPVGVLPPTGGGHGLSSPAVADAVKRAAADPAAAAEVAAIADVAAIEPPAGECVHLGVRRGEADGLTITVDPQLGTASAVGFLLMYSGGDPHSGEPGTVVGRPRVDATWTGIGDIGSGKSKGSFTRGTYSSENSYTYSSRDATMGGILGPMGFAPGLSGGTMNISADQYSEQF
jgi:hypothetical protein